MYKNTPMQPFGLLVEANGESSLDDLAPSAVAEMVARHKALVLRGFAPMTQEALIEYANGFGPLLRWEFGELLNLRIEKKPPNHLFGFGRVEMHWDGAYLTEVPRFSLFQCLEASPGEEGGETLFTDTEKMLAMATPQERAQWQSLTVRYSTAKAAHYGGDVKVPLVGAHPVNGKPNVRFIEPFNEDNLDVHPVNVEVLGMEKERQDAFLRQFTARLYDDACMYRHRWHKGDFLIYDNNALLHGRSTIKSNISRHLQRVHILDGAQFAPSRTPVFIGPATEDVHL